MASKDKPKKERKKPKKTPLKPLQQLNTGRTVGDVLSVEHKHGAGTLTP